MLNNRDLLRGVCLIGIALVFGVPALQYPIGDLARAGPGMFPLFVSSMLLLVGLATVVRSRFVERMPMMYSFKNVGLILGSLVVFAVVSRAVNMTLGIILLVFCAAAAAPPYSIVRNLQIAAVLIAIAFAFQRLFGLELNLY